MRAVDRRCIEGLGIPGLTLMENASRAVYAELRRHHPDLDSRAVTVVCGKGNNGGDGLATARHIAAGGGRVNVILLARGADLRGDARTNLDRACAAGVGITEASDEEVWRQAWAALKPDLVVDGIFGTGLTSPARGIYGLAIEDITTSGARVVSIDVPSGLSSDTPEIFTPSIHANLTVALQCLKICHALPPACEQCGEVVVVPIGIPEEVIEDPAHGTEMIDSSVAEILPPRPRDTHKGHYGHVLVVAGSLGKTGAAVMTGMAAYRAGAGLVTVATPRSCLPIVAAGAPEIMTEPLDETPQGTLAFSAIERIAELAVGKDTLVVGPGLTTAPSTRSAVRELVRSRRQPMVLDADGVNCFAGDRGALKAAAEDPPLVITPHPGEFSRLCGVSTQEVVRDRAGHASRLASELGITVVLKGYRTVVGAPDGRLFINPTGNPGMATGGAGDVLTGIAGGFLAQRLPLPGAINFAVYIHGRAGDIAAEDVGETSLVATDLLRALPAAFRSIACTKQQPDRR